MSKSKSLSRTEIAAALAKHDATLVTDLLRQADIAAAAVKSGSNVELRKAAHVKALKEANAVELVRVAAAQDDILPLGSAIAAVSDEIMERGFNTDEALKAMDAFLKIKLASEAETSIQELVRTLVFRTMDLAAAEQGEDFPEHTNMSIDVPELGKRFVREGCGRKDASFDVDALQAALDPEVFAAITAEQVVVTRFVDHDALAAAVLANPDLLETVREAVLPGGWKSARLMIRDIPAHDDTEG
jgi:hypothetical protein